MRLLLSCLALAATVSAQSLSTTFANNNGGAVGGAVYFDLNVVGLVTITDLDLNFGSAAGTTGTITVYAIPGGTYVGNQANPAAWQLFGTSNTITSAGPGQPSLVTFPGGGLPPIGPGPGGCAIVANGLAHAYTNGTTTQTTFTSPFLDLIAGSASNVPFTAPTFNPRIVNTNIRYSPGAGTPATNTSLGQGCYRRFASFYENFAAGTNDLANSCINLNPQANGGYVVTGTGVGYSPPGPTATVVPLTDDSQAAVGTLGLTVGSNGWVAFGAGNSNGFTPDVPTFLNNPSTAAYTWHDMNPAIAGSGQVWYEETVVPGGGTAIITYDGVWDFGGTSTASANFIRIIITCQGLSWTIEIELSSLSTAGNGWLVGYSPGGTSNDPGNTDISSALAGGLALTLAGADVNPLALAASTRPVTGTNWNLAVSNGALVDLCIVGVNDPMIPDLFFLGLPGCGLRASLDLITVGSTLSIGIPANPTLVGQSLFANGASLAPGVNAFGAITSNGIQGTIGDI